MKTLYSKYSSPKKLINFNYLKLLFLGLILIIASCNEDDESCEYTEICEEYCELFEDFEDDKVENPGNWLGLSLNDLQIQLRVGSNVLYVDDGSGASWAYNTTDFPSNLIAQGCELHYDVEYFAGANNNTATNNSLVIFDGTSPAASSNIASFVLDPASLVISGNAPVTIEVPLKLTTGTTLPSNTFGAWTINGVNNTTPPTPADILTFNTLIQNISGVAFFIDEGGNPVEEWWFDNFCFKQCCP